MESILAGDGIRDECTAADFRLDWLNPWGTRSSERCVRFGRAWPYPWVLLGAYHPGSSSLLVTLWQTGANAGWHLGLSQLRRGNLVMSISMVCPTFFGNLLKFVNYETVYL